MIPARLVTLGTLLDLTVEHEGRRFVLRFKSKHWLCSDTGARRLFITPKTTVLEKRPPSRGKAGKLFEKWNDFDPRRELIEQVKVGTPEYRGRVIAVGYRSAKWRREMTDYQHDFDTPPRLTQLGQVYRIAGGDVRVTSRGITG